MHPLAKRIALVVSLFCPVLGLFLLSYNLRLIPDSTLLVALNLWPLILIVSGLLLIFDSLKKRKFTRSSMIETKEFPLLAGSDPQELICRVSFSYGTLNIGPAGGEPSLLAEQIGSMGDPVLVREERGSASVLTIAMTQPLFPSYFQLLNTWSLTLPPSIPLRLDTHLHEVNLSMDLRRLRVETLEMKAGSGRQEIHIGSIQKKFTGQIYSSSSDLSIVLPPRSYIQIALLNPFCRVDYPQGDLERNEDGSFVSVDTRGASNRVEITIDGPIKNLVLDIGDEDAAAVET
jgi:hypothetical protein